MKTMRNRLALLLALALLMTLCACGGKEAPAPETESGGGSLAADIREAVDTAGPAPDPAESAPDLAEYAGEYTFFCAKFSAAYLVEAFELDGAVQDVPDQYVDMPEMAAETVTLDADGTGYLYWGDDNQGPIDWWEMDGDALRFQAGVAVIEGTIDDGLMTLGIDDGFSVCFMAPDADAPAIEPITVDEYVTLLYGAAPDGDEAEAETAAAPEFPVEGEYTLFAVQNEGYTVDSDDLETRSTITLVEDGTGYMTNNDDSIDITSWTAEGETFHIEVADESSADGIVHGGVIELDIMGTGAMIFFYAQEGADLSGYEVMSLDEYSAALAADVPDSRLYALWSGLDTAAGVHLSYDRHTDYMDADQSFDVHGKDGVYYSRRTTYVSGYENTVVTFFRDGTAYNLYPEDMTGIVATTTSSSAITDNIMRLDDLYAVIWTHAQESDYTEETREMDGVSYAVEVFAETEYTPEAAFYFDDAGQLAYCIEGAPVVEGAMDIGESVYTIHAMDGAVDETLFDISGYEITE